MELEKLIEKIANCGGDHYVNKDSSGNINFIHFRNATIEDSEVWTSKINENRPYDLYFTDCIFKNVYFYDPQSTSYPTFSDCTFIKCDSDYDITMVKREEKTFVPSVDLPLM